MNIKSELQTTKMLTLSETTNMQASVLAGKIKVSNIEDFFSESNFDT